MSEHGGEPKPDRDRDLAADLRLRPERPPVTRLSRKVLMGLAAVAAISVSSALIWGLYQGQKKSTGGTELYNTENKPTPDGLTTLPRDYSSLPRSSFPPTASGVPQLGPPLPGDLGRPIRNAQVSVPVPGEPPINADQQRAAQETEAARVSRLFATTNARERPTTPIALPATTATDQAPGTLTGRVEPPPFDPDSILNMQDRKLAFLTAAVDRKTVSPDRLTNPASRYVVQAGAVIPAALITGIRSDLPGQVTAQVTEHVYDSPTGKYLLIPQGSKLIGVYDSQILVRTGPRAPGLDEADHAEWPLDRAGAPARRRHARLRRPGGRGRPSLGTAVHGGRALDAARRRRRTRRCQQRQRHPDGAQARQHRQPEPGRTASGAPEPQHSADHHHPAGLPGAGDRQSRSGAFALQELRAFAMAKLKLSAVPDDRPVKLTVELPAAVHRDLVAYADLLARQNGQKIEPAKLVAPMLARFMSTDRAFLRARRERKDTS